MKNEVLQKEEKNNTGRSSHSADVPKKNYQEEKIRDELFEYRVDIKSYKAKLNVIIYAGSILLVILAFFGYDKIENIETTILDRAGERLAQTDSILAKIDQPRIDSINRLLLLKEQEYSVVISNFEKIVQQSLEIQGKLLESISENERTDNKTDVYTQEYSTDVFIIHPFNRELIRNQVEYVYIVFNDGVEFSEEDYLSISLKPKGRGIILFSKNYAVSSKFNKVSFAIEPFEDYKEYELHVSYFKKESKNYRRFYVVEDIKLK